MKLKKFYSGSQVVIGAHKKARSVKLNNRLIVLATTPHQPSNQFSGPLASGTNSLNRTKLWFLIGATRSEHQWKISFSFLSELSSLSRYWVHTFATSHITFSAWGHWAPLGKCREVWVLLLGNCVYWLLCFRVLEGAPQCSVLLGKLAPNWSCARPIKDSNTVNPASLATLPFPPDLIRRCYCGKFLYAQLCIHTVDLFAGLQTLILKLKLSVSFLLLLEFCFLWYVALWRVCTSKVCK